LADHRSPSTANAYRSALRGVRPECWRLGYLEYEELARILAVEAVSGSCLLHGRALSRGELVAIFGHIVEKPAVAARRGAALVAILYASGGVRRAEASGRSSATSTRPRTGWWYAARATRSARLHANMPARSG